MDKNDLTQVTLEYDNGCGDLIRYSVPMPFGQICKVIELMDDLEDDGYGATELPAGDNDGAE